MPEDIVKAIQKTKRPMLEFPVKPMKAAHTDSSGILSEDEFDMGMFNWKENYKAMMTKKEKYEKNKLNVWALIFNKCLPELKNKLEGANRYKASKNINDVVLLLTMIRGFCCQFNTLNDEDMLIVEAIKNLLYLFQKPTQSNLDYHKDYMAMIEVVNEYGGASPLTYFPNMIKKQLESKGINMDQATGDKLKKAKKVVRGKFLAALMLNGSNQDKYGDLMHSIVENYVTGMRNYPKSPDSPAHS
jgi:hypothetical protein